MLVKKFPDRRRMIELCKFVISEMTPLDRGAVVDGTMKADEVLREDLGGMQNSLDSLLMCNDDGPRSGFPGPFKYGVPNLPRGKKFGRVAEVDKSSRECAGGARFVQGSGESGRWRHSGQNFLAPASLAQTVESKSTNVEAGWQRTGSICAAFPRQEGLVHKPVGA